MRKRALLLVMGLIMVLTACSKTESKTNSGIIKQTTEAVTEESTEESTKLSIENNNDVIVETIGTTEIQLEESQLDVGIVETEEAGGFVGIDEEEHIISQLSIASVAEELTLTEDQSITLDGIMESWLSDPTMQKSYLQYMINNSSISTLSSEEKQLLINNIVNSNPHEINENYEVDFSNEENGKIDKSFETVSQEEALKNAETALGEN